MRILLPIVLFFLSIVGNFVVITATNVVVAAQEGNKNTKTKSKSNKGERSHAMRSNYIIDPEKKVQEDSDENYKWLNFDCQVCTALCGELDRCVKETPIDHPYSEIVDCAIANTTSNYAFDPATNLIRRLPSAVTEKKERLRMERELSAAHNKHLNHHQQQQDGSGSSSTPSSSIRERIEKSLTSHLDTYHQQVVLHAMVASGKTRHTRHSVPADICLDLLCHQHLHVCHEDEHPEAKTVEERRKELIPGIHTKSLSLGDLETEGNDNNDNDDNDNDDDDSRTPTLRKMAHDHDSKFSVHHDHHNHFKHHFSHFVDHFENTLNGEKRSHGRHIHPPTRRHSAFHPSAKSDIKEEDRERVTAFAHAGEKPSSQEDL